MRRDANRETVGPSEVFEDKLRRITPARVIEKVDPPAPSAIHNEDPFALNPEGAIVVHAVNRGRVDERSRELIYAELINVRHRWSPTAKYFPSHKTLPGSSIFWFNEMSTNLLRPARSSARWNVPNITPSTNKFPLSS